MSRPGKIRIVSGQWRGRKLEVPDLPGLRPTPERVRETLFNWLQNEITGARCLDLFSGTGALGFESLSRGASEVVMVESNAGLVDLLRKHAKMFGSEAHIIQQGDGISWLKQAGKAFDIIFLDPPFGEGYIEKCCHIIHASALLNSNGLLYVESEKGLSLTNGWKIKKQTTTAQVQSLLIEPE